MIYTIACKAVSQTQKMRLGHRQGWNRGSKQCPERKKCAWDTGRGGIEVQSSVPNAKNAPGTQAKMKSRFKAMFPNAFAENLHLRKLRNSWIRIIGLPGEASICILLIAQQILQQADRGIGHNA